ncbi:MAG: H-type lectin domain-containing protein, partial [Pseudomonadota bacterium]
MSQASFHKSLPVLLRIAASALLLLCFPSQANAGRIEAGVFEAHDTLGSNRTPDRVNFQQQFDTPPIVVAIPSSVGNNSASIRITNVTTTGFDELILEPDNWDGRHLAMDTYYIAVEPGRHVLPDGTVIEAGFTDLSNVQFGSGFTGGVASWSNVTFTAPLLSTPLILHQLQTANSETRDIANQASRPHITSIAQSPSTFGFQLAIERSQANSGPFPSSERIGWIAFPDGANGSFEDI